MHVDNFDSTVNVIKSHLEEYLQEHGIDTTKNFKCINPKHNDKSPSCALTKDKLHFHCFGLCGIHGDIFDACYLIENKPKIGVEWVTETFKYLADKYGIEISTSKLTEEDIYKLDTYKAYNDASQIIAKSPLSPSVLQEISRRGWNQEALSKMYIGSVVSYSDFRKLMRDKGYTVKFLDDIGLDKKELFNQDSLIFTWKDQYSRPVGFISRDVLFEEKTKQSSYKGSKYYNTRTINSDIFQKGKSFYGLEEATKYNKSKHPIFIFEGQADVITARLSGIHNCMALSSSTIREDHIQLLKKLNIYNICICLDADLAGRTRTLEFVNTIGSSHKDIKISIIDLPDGKDPDQYIRESGKVDFLKLAKWSIFEWKLNQYQEDDDEIEICKQMVPFIAREQSPITRDYQAKILAKRTGMSLNAILQEIHLLIDEKQNRHAKDRQEILDRAIYELKNNPKDAETILQKAQFQLLELIKKSDLDTLSSEDFIASLDQQKSHEEKLTIDHSGFKLGTDLKELEDILRGDWSEGAFITCAARPNAGKSAFLCKLAYSIASNNEDVVVIYHTIDDTFEQLTPRFIAIAEGSKSLTMNMVRQPHYWSQVVNIPNINDKRNLGYTKVRELAQQGKLIVKDIKHGSTLSFIENLICYYKDKHPERKVVFILDNFHKLRDFAGSKDERVRFKALSESVKAITLRHRCCFIATVEYTKVPPGIKPHNNLISETTQIEYDASVILHLYSDVADNPHSFSICHESLNHNGEKVFLPRVECIIGKNKITEIKKSFFLDFWPASSDFACVNQKKVLQESERMKKMVKDGSFNQLNNVIDDMDDLY